MVLKCTPGFFSLIVAPEMVGGVSWHATVDYSVHE
jgi:hypothetical protein